MKVTAERLEGKIIKDIGRIAEAQEEGSGRNSRVYKARLDDGRTIAIKYYEYEKFKNKILQIYSSINREIKALRYLERAKISNVPKLLSYNDKERWIATTWLYGKKVKLIDERDGEEIAKFINRTNSQDIVELRKRLGIAKEACQSIESLSSDMNRRLRMIQNYIPKTKIEQKVNEWIINNLMPESAAIIKELIQKEQDSQWQEREKCSYFSQSDVGVHNLLKNENGLAFYDFEYAGRDDLAKLVNDWSLNPNNALNENQRNSLISKIAGTMHHVGQSWIKRAEDTKEYYRAKWCMIILNQYLMGEANEKMLEKLLLFYSITRR